MYTKIGMFHEQVKIKKIKGGLPPGLGEREASIVLVEERKMGFVLMIPRNIYLYVHKPLLV